MTLPLSDFDSKELVIYQNPRSGVQTKFSKYINSILFKFDDRLVKYVIEWVNHIKSKNFRDKDPLFPRSKVKQDSKNPSFDNAMEVEPKYWNHAGAIRKIFKNRSSKAGLTYFPPHTFRHLAVEYALKYCKNGEQIKAVSQNFGHEYVSTTIESYANFETKKLFEILNSIDFSGKSNPYDDKMRRIRDILDE